VPTDDRHPTVRAPAEDRLGRLLAVVPWVASHDGPTVLEVCERFGVAEDELLADLDLLFLCGVHPFTPDTLIEVDVADGRVWIRFADWFRRPLQLTPPEGLALVSAGSTLLAMPGADLDGALATALAKLETVLGVSTDAAIDVELGAVTPSVLDTVRAATDHGRKVRIDYYSFGRDERRLRTVQPWRVFAAAGQWYLTGWCELAEGERLFRLDRVRTATVLDEPSGRPPPGDGPTRLFHPDPAAPIVVLDLAPDARWVAEQYPNEGVEVRADGRLRVTLRVGERAWLERLLLRAGAAATIVEGDPTIVADAARRILHNYRGD
jgi:proteasome accessory factor C